MYTVVYTKAAAKHITLLKSANLDKRAKKLVDLVTEKPFQNPPPYEKLPGDMNGLCPASINIQAPFWCIRYTRRKKPLRLSACGLHYEF